MRVISGKVEYVATWLVNGSMKADLVRCCCARARGELENHTKQLNTEQLSAVQFENDVVGKAVQDSAVVKKIRFLLHVSTILPFFGAFSVT